MKTSINLALSMIVFSVLTASSAFAATQTPVTFNGEFANGTTLYSDPYHIVSGKVGGVDIYPDRSMIPPRQKVCELKNRTITERQCVNNTLGYRNVTKKYCFRNDRDSPVVCEYRVYQQATSASKICENVKVNQSYEVCHYEPTPSVAIGCLDPQIGVYTNQLRLINFKMSTDNSTWVDIPYINNKAEFTNTDIMFKVDIPALCSPAYHLDRAIRILS